MTLFEITKKRDPNNEIGFLLNQLNDEMELTYGLSADERSAFCHGWLATSTKLIHKIVKVAFSRDPDIIEYRAFAPYRFSDTRYFVAVVSARYSNDHPYRGLGIVIEQGHDESRIMLAPGSLVDEFTATGNLSSILDFCDRDGNQAFLSRPTYDFASVSLRRPSA